MNPLDIRRAQRLALIAGVLGVVLCAIGAVISPAEFFRSYLIAYMFWAGLALGSLSLVLLHFLVGGNWGFAIRRLLESATRTLPLLAVLLLPLFFGLPHVYGWANADEVAHNVILQHKTGYLNVPFFAARLALYFAVWLGLAWVVNRWSAEQDRRRDLESARRFRAFSGPALIVHVFAVTFAAVDLLMSLEPEFFSTIFGAIILVGQVLATLAFSVILLLLLSPRQPLQQILGPSHFHDLGNLLLAFTMFWAYVEISQFIIIWHGNLPEEVPWYIRRSNNGWQYLTAFVALFAFAAPFLLLLNRFVKRRARLLAWVAGWLLVMRLVSLIWMVRPAFWSSLAIHWLDIVTPLALGGLWLAFFFWQLERRPLLPEGDVRFAEVA